MTHTDQIKAWLSVPSARLVECCSENGRHYDKIETDTTVSFYENGTITAYLFKA